MPPTTVPETGNRQFGSVVDLLAEVDDDPTAIFKG